MLILAFGMGEATIFSRYAFGIRNAGENTDERVDCVITADGRARLQRHGSCAESTTSGRERGEHRLEGGQEKDVKFAKCGTEQRTASEIAERGLKRSWTRANLSLHRRYL